VQGASTKGADTTAHRAPHIRVRELRPTQKNLDRGTSQQNPPKELVPLGLTAPRYLR
jgi:hypothetical protein